MTILSHVYHFEDRFAISLYRKILIRTHHSVEWNSTTFIGYLCMQRRVLDGEDLFVNKSEGPLKSVEDIWDHED